MMRAAFVSLGLALCLALTFSGRAPARGYCEIEIVNNRDEQVMVLVTFEDKSTTHFIVYPYEAPHHISLFSHGYCHSGAHVRVEQRPHGHVVYNSWTPQGSTIRIVRY